MKTKPVRTVVKLVTESMIVPSSATIRQISSVVNVATLVIWLEIAPRGPRVLIGETVRLPLLVVLVKVMLLIVSLR